MDAFGLAFSGGGIDRAAHLRGDPPALRALAHDPRAGVLAIWDGALLHTDAEGQRLCWRHPGDASLAGAEALYFLGLDNGAPRFAADLPPGAPTEAGGDGSAQRPNGMPADGTFLDLRRTAPRLGPAEAELAATARALALWHAAHGFCARCGAPTVPAQGGWQRDCSACLAHHYPRTDPVVIMLVTRHDRALIGRSPAWPEGMYSLLAGFVEPGETVEAAVRREVQEEAGIAVGPVGYVGSQPWPFPTSLMIACHGVALDDEIAIDPAEIEAARWVGRTELLQALAGRHPQMSAARPGAIARWVIEAWLAGRLTPPSAMAGLAIDPAGDCRAGQRGTPPCD